jgi:BirA family biotin operon repressor/biotin-[acetyl-CoA-carboxylase] ligase
MAELQWNAETLWQQLEPLLPGLSIEVLPRCESTNTLLLQRARAQDVQPCLLVAEEQTGGRGRMGRVWHAQPGASLTFSLALPLAPRDWSGLSLAVGVALADALDADARIGLKWPNDLWLADGSDRKLGGILIETVTNDSRRIAVIGIGLNIAPQAQWPQAAYLQEIGVPGDAPLVLQRIALPLLQAIQTFEHDGFAPFAERFAARDVLRGRAITSTATEVPDGVALGVDAQGVLRVRRGELEHRLASGEVSVRPQPAPKGS